MSATLTPGCLGCDAAGEMCAYCQHWSADRDCPQCGKVTPTADVRGLWGCAVCEWPRTTGATDAGHAP